MIFGLIPARGGSKGVPKKNIRLVAGKPLICYAIQCGLDCASIDRLMVSTDSQEIADIANSCGAAVERLRPDELARDSMPMLPVMQHAIESVEAETGESVALLVLLDPTAPLRTVDDVEKAIAMCLREECDAVVSANSAHRSPYFNMVKCDKYGFASLVIGDGSVGRRQDVPEVFDLNTVVWVYKRDTIMQKEERLPKRTRLFMVPRERSIDLDTENDFSQLEAILQARANQL